MVAYALNFTGRGVVCRPCSACVSRRRLVGANPAPAPAKVDTSQPEAKFSSGVTQVNVLFTVTDKKGRFVTDLTVNDFEVIENKKTQLIQQFTAESDLPLRMAMLIDTSNSIRDKFRFEQQAAIRFLNDVIRPKDDRMMLISFDTSAELVSDLTKDMSALEKGINSACVPGAARHSTTQSTWRRKG